MNARAWQIAFLVLCVSLALVLAYHLRSVFLPLLVALLLAYILNPLVTAMERRRVPRIASIAAIYGAFLVLFAAGLVVLGPKAVDEATEFHRNVFEEGAPEIRNRLDQVAARLQEMTGRDWRKDLETLQQQVKDHAGEIARTLGRGLVSFLGGLFSALSFILLVPVYLFFFLRSLNDGWGKFKASLPERYRDRILETLANIHRANAAFFRGQLTICLIEGLLLFAALSLLGVRFSFLLSLVYAGLALVPFVGPVVGLAAAGVVVVTQTGGFGPLFLGVLGVYAGIQVLESVVLQPFILGKETGLHPVLIILSIFIFGQLFGFFGVLLAVPLCSATLILTREYVLPLAKSVAGETT